MVRARVPVHFDFVMSIRDRVWVKVRFCCEFRVCV